MRKHSILTIAAILITAGAALANEPAQAPDDKQPTAATPAPAAPATGNAQPSETSKPAQAEKVRVTPVDASAQEPAEYTGPVIRVHDAPVNRASRDARVEYGDIKISRLRLDDSPARPGEASATRAARADGAIVLPSNTYGEGESLQQRATREASERRSLEALAREDEARADAAQAIAARTNDIIDDSVIYAGGHRYYYPGAVYGPGRYGRPPGLRGPLTTTRERFVNTDAYFNYADAARPRIAGPQRNIDEAIRQAAEPTRHREIGRIQRQTDEAQRRNLQRVPVEEK